jgi:CubicO group peptidase (beta-lactamase class C family)/dipeptidase
MKKRILLVALFGWILCGLWAFGCDTWVALSDSTRNGLVLFAKNSDRLIFSSQPLEFHPRRQWPDGSEIDLGRLSIPQVPTAYATLGSSPYWCWGYEQGINEFSVAIGNEGVDTKALAAALSEARAGKGPAPGPTGMDLLRLGLERGRTAREALDVITQLLEKHGQFGSGLPTMRLEGAYDNSFLIADSREAWVLETAGRRWAAKKISSGTASISNTIGIGSSYDLASPDIKSHAVESGWWPGDKSPFHFAQAYRNDSPVGNAKSRRAQIRADCSLALLHEKKADITPGWMKRIARDRSTNPSLDLNVTASSTVALLPSPDKGIPVFWWCPSVPSSSCYVPFFVHGLRLPETISKAGTAGTEISAPSRADKDTFDQDSYWWIFRDLADTVNRDRPGRLPVVRAAFDELEKDFEEGLDDLLDRAHRLRQQGLTAEAGEILDDYSRSCVNRALKEANTLRDRFSKEPAKIPELYQPYIGTYIGNFGAFRDARFPVEWYEGKLSVTIPGQGRTALRDPDESGRWHFEQDPNVAVSFDVQEGEGPSALLFHQTTRLPRSNDVRQTGSAPPEFRPLIGSYTVPGTNRGYNIILKDGGLALEVPNQAVIPLEGPDSGNRWKIRFQPGTEISFIEESGRITAMALIQVFRLPRQDPPRPRPEEGRADPIEFLSEELESMREDYHVPGMAVAVVRDGRVVLSRGFGLADLEKKTPVTPDTIFSIGSSSKAFTATLIGMLVDEGKMAWDDPAEKYLPEFRLPIRAEDKEAAVTIRDLLTHRTGFTRGNMIWVNEALDRREVLEQASKAEPWADFRSRFLYNNIQYMAAGVAAGRAAESDWDSLIRDRLFRPLGMSSTFAGRRSYSGGAPLASGYLWDEAYADPVKLPFRGLHSVAPAGAVISTASDMARWIMFQLGEGEWHGNRLISRKEHRETWTPQMQMGGGAHYGLAWMINKWQDKTVIAHGGNVDGFSAQVALIPEENIGFVCLTNSTSCPLPNAVTPVIWEAFLGKPGAKGTGSEEENLSAFEGDYIANFGTFKDVPFKVGLKEGALAMDIPQRGTFFLSDPDEQGRRPLTQSPDVAVQFEKDGQDRVFRMKLFQGGYTFELPRAGVPQPAEIPMGEMSRYTGHFYGEKLKETLEIKIQNNHLALDIPGQTVYELFPPDAEGRWYFRMSDKVFLTFPASDNTPVDSFTYHEGEAVLEYKRIEGEGPRLPGLEEINLLRNTSKQSEAFAGAGIIHITGRVRLPQSGLEGRLDWYAGEKGRHVRILDFGRFGRLGTAVDGSQGWTETMFLPVLELKGPYLEQAEMEHPAALFGDWMAFFSAAEVLTEHSQEGRRDYSIRLSGKSVPPLTLRLNGETGDILFTTHLLLRPGSQARFPIQTRYEDYREVEGLRLPFLITQSSDYFGSIVIEIENVKTGAAFPKDIFRMGTGQN